MPLFYCLKGGFRAARCSFACGITVAPRKAEVLQLGISPCPVTKKEIFHADLLEMLNSTEDEADEMIGSYGEFPESEISSINRQQNEEHVPYAAAPTYPVAPPDPQPVSTVSEPPQQPSPVLEVSTPTEPETAVPEAASGAEQHRYIRCPKCGELICL